MYCVLQVHKGLREMDQHELQVTANTAAGGWGHSGFRRPAVLPEELQELRGTLLAAERTHSQLRQTFLKGLPGAANEVRLGFWLN